MISAGQFYVEGFDKNVSRIARFIQKFRFSPLAGKGEGLRQPVHGADLAAATAKIRLIKRPTGKIYNVAGGEILTYAEMVGRIFDGFGHAASNRAGPAFGLENGLFGCRPVSSGSPSAMGSRMSEDLVFDATAAAQTLAGDRETFIRRLQLFPKLDLIGSLATYAVGPGNTVPCLAFQDNAREIKAGAVTHANSFLVPLAFPRSMRYQTAAKLYEACHHIDRVHYKLIAGGRYPTTKSTIHGRAKASASE